MDDGLEFYREHILDHARSPRNWGLLEQPDIDHQEANTLCGDHLHLTLKVEDGLITAVGWDGDGCAISQASASLLGERITGMRLEDALQLQRSDILDLIGISLSPNRMRCALLSLKVLVVGAAGTSHWERIEDSD